jgi:hypothetical protein
MAVGRRIPPLQRKGSSGLGRRRREGRRGDELSHFDLASLLQTQELTHLPVMVHPGYGFLSSDRILKGALSIAAAGVSGLLIDILPKDYPEIYGSGTLFGLGAGGALNRPTAGSLSADAQRILPQTISPFPRTDGSRAWTRS